MTNELVVVGTLEFNSPVNRDDGYRNHRLAENTKSIMTMYKMEYGYQIEWEIPELDEVEHMNLYTAFHNQLDYIVDYDGVFELPNEVKGWLDKLHISYDADLFE